MSMCVVSGKACQCQPEEGFPCPGVVELRAQVERLQAERGQVVACSRSPDGEHLFAYFGDEVKRRRCNWCCALELVGPPAVAQASKFGSPELQAMIVQQAVAQAGGADERAQVVYQLRLQARDGSGQCGSWMEVSEAYFKRMSTGRDYQARKLYTSLPAVVPDERAAIIRAAVAAMPHTNPLVADDLIEGHTMHTEADDIVAIWRAALAAQPTRVAMDSMKRLEIAERYSTRNFTDHYMPLIDLIVADVERHHGITPGDGSDKG